MHQAPVPPGRECSITQASELAREREPFRTISPGEQEAVELAPFFETFRALLYRLARQELAKQEMPNPPEEAA